MSKKSKKSKMKEDSKHMEQSFDDESKEDEISEIGVGAEHSESFQFSIDTDNVPFNEKLSSSKRNKSKKSKIHSSHQDYVDEQSESSEDK